MPSIMDLFCGIGGVAEATRDHCDPPLECGQDPFRVVAAIDIDRRVGPVYKTNHGVQPQHRTLESVDAIPEADLWWLSPPCQPYTRRGQGRAELDPRSAALKHLIERIDRQRPQWVVLENVSRFAGSVHHQRLAHTLRQAGYHLREDHLCPTAWGVPMRRPRFYLRAARDGDPLADVTPVPRSRTLNEYLDDAAWDDDSLKVDAEQLRRYQAAMRIVDAGQRTAIASCLTSAYGDSPVRSGSYLCRSGDPHVRRFSPHEITRLMGFRDDFWWPPELCHRSRYRLLGNALCVTVVRELLRSLR